MPLKEAVIESLSKSIPEISSSSLTTVGGLVAMLFMQFRIGSDMAVCSSSPSSLRCSRCSWSCPAC